MKGWHLISILLFTSVSYAQENLRNPDSLKVELLKTPVDTNRVLLLCDISYSYRYSYLDSAHSYAIKALELSKALHYTNGEAWANLLIGIVHAIRGRVPLSVSHYERSAQLADSIRNYLLVSRALAQIGWSAFDLTDYYRAIDYFKRSLKYQQELGNQEEYIITLQTNIGQCYLSIKKLEEAETYLNLAFARGKEKNPNYGYLLNMFASLRLQQKKYLAADSILKEGWALIVTLRDKIDKADNRYYYAQLELAHNHLSKAYEYATEALGYYQQMGSKVDLERIYEFLSNLESSRGKVDQSLNYLRLSNAMRDSVSTSKATYSEYLFDQREQERQSQLNKKEKELVKAEKRNQQILWTGMLFVFVASVAGLSFFSWQKQRNNKQLRELNKELLKKEAAITLQNQQLREMNFSKDKLFSIIGHDLRGPLLSITGFLNLLSINAGSLSEDELKKFMDDLDRSLKNLFNLLENLLEWSLSQTGTIDFKAEVFDIAASLKENSELLDNQARHKNISIENKSELSLMVKAHPNSIHTVIRNLISNAIKFTPPGGKITLRAEPQNNYVRISVEDTGEGISSELAAKLFKVGVKHTTPGTSNEKGSGLGLILCKEFVEKNGGTIGLESSVGRGSVFYFTVPSSQG